MPLLILDGAEAVRTRKENPFAQWGARGEPNRVEPYARPGFDAPFQLEPGEKIFTIGSCFARNIEAELARRGFAIPMRDLFRVGPFAGLGNEIVNNYGTPSIFNELAWAFGEEPFDEASEFVELSDGRFVDLHIANSVRPGALDEVRVRRAALLEATRQLAGCRVLVMTLGLVELWFDTRSGRYLNTAPLPMILHRWPDRFELHVLSFDEAHGYLRRALDIAARHARPDLRVILTVSPVPMFATHRRADVLVANGYSKAVLRAVAEHVWMEDARVSYFPSFESVTLSDRRVAWADDLVHVTPEIVALNVGRMVDAFTGAANPGDERLPIGLDRTVETPEAVLLIEEARNARLADDAGFFARHAARSEQSHGFLLEHARFLHARGDDESALALLARSHRPEAALLIAEIELARGRPAEAAAIMRPFCRPGGKSVAHWRMLIDATTALGDRAGLLAIEADWLHSTHQGLAENTRFHIARALKRLGDLPGAIARFRIAEAFYQGSNAFVAIETAAALIEGGYRGEAAAVLDGATPETDWHRKRLGQLREKLATEASVTS